MQNHSCISSYWFISSDNCSTLICHYLEELSGDKLSHATRRASNEHHTTIGRCKRRVSHWRCSCCGLLAFPSQYVSFSISFHDKAPSLACERIRSGLARVGTLHCACAPPAHALCPCPCHCHSFLILPSRRSCRAPLSCVSRQLPPACCIGITRVQ